MRKISKGKQMKATKKFIAMLTIAAFASGLYAANNAGKNAQGKKYDQPKYEWTIETLPAGHNKDNANFMRYKAANAKLEKKPIAVFMGDSITDLWATKDPEFFAKNNFVGRGIGGQVTSQMLVRFRRDVIDLKPEVVLILAGTNDIARNGGYIAEENIVGNIISMCELAKANGITPVICSILPAAEYPWCKQVVSPNEAVQRVNAKLAEYAKANDIVYVDYYKSLDNGKGGLDSKTAKDGIHPTIEGYKVMETLALKGVEQARLSRLNIFEQLFN